MDWSLTCTLYIMLDQDDPAETIKWIEAYVMEIKAWILKNGLKLNDKNTLLFYEVREQWNI